MASVNARCPVSLIDFFLLQNCDFSFAKVCRDVPCRKRLAFYGDAVLKASVIKTLMGRQGLQWPQLCRRTEQLVVSNAHLSVVFDKLKFPEAISLVLHKSAYECRKYSVHYKATYTEAMLGLTELLAAEHTCAVAASIIDLCKESSDSRMMFNMKPDKPALRLKLSKSAGRLKSVKSPKSAQSPAERQPAKSWVKAQTAKPTRSLPETRSAELAVEMKAAKSAVNKKFAKTTKCRLNCFDVLGSRTACKISPAPASVRPCHQDTETAVTLRAIDTKTKPAYRAVRRKDPFSLHGGVQKKVRNTHLIFLTP